MGEVVVKTVWWMCIITAFLAVVCMWVCDVDVQIFAGSALMILVIIAFIIEGGEDEDYLSDN